MNESITKLVAENFLSFKGYLVKKNIPIKLIGSPKFWTELDLFAVGSKEILLINCRDSIASSKDRDLIVKQFQNAELYLQGYYTGLNWDIRRKLLVHIDTDPKSLKHFHENSIETIHLDVLLDKYIQAISKQLEDLSSSKTYKPPKGTKWYEITQLSTMDKLIAHLIYSGKIKGQS